ncbi:unnamed protein product [Hymenolepis diminuta]|uniref:Uncharacterized protein n=1 Tax=Hymenolepis diminuta TaxID=6216 RepID=A0A564Y695_HYMDI|nr:unnamed protein product [Hymenolepis diminuta]
MSIHSFRERKMVVSTRGCSHRQLATRSHPCYRCPVCYQRRLPLVCASPSRMHNHPLRIEEDTLS